MKKAYTLLFDGYADWELGYVLPELRRIGKIDVVTVGFTDNPVVSMGGLRVIPEKVLSKVNIEDVLIFILPGGHMWEGTYDSLVKKEGLFSELVKKEEGKELPPIAKLVIDRVDEITFTEDSKVSYLLSLCPIFSHMTDLHISYIQKVADISPFSKGEFIYKPGDGSNELYIILRGEVELFYEFKENGISKEKILQSLKPVEIFGEIELFGGEKRKTGARTMCGTILCVIKKKDLMDLISADSCMAIALLKHICSKSAT